MSEYVARLDKATRLKVLCAYSTCRGQLGDILKLGKPGTQGFERRLVMPPGWLPDEARVWRQIMWQEARDDRERRIQYPTAGERDGASRRLQPRFREGYIRNAAARTARDLGEKPNLRPAQRSAFVFDFPAFAECPVCHHVNRLDSARLDVETTESRLERFRARAVQIVNDLGADPGERAVEATFLHWLDRQAKA